MRGYLPAASGRHKPENVDSVSGRGPVTDEGPWSRWSVNLEKMNRSKPGPVTRLTSGFTGVWTLSVSVLILLSLTPVSAVSQSRKRHHRLQKFFIRGYTR